ncbi:transcriptional activator of glycolytic enzymes-domain-containing protein [Pilaira anomala]|nr:transcriptional activator of glycolytic enzymes-domain-containing protein [Pilaira anomala]
MSENRGTLTMIHPRGETLKAYERSLKNLCSVARNTEDYVDPGMDQFKMRGKKAGDELRDRMVFLLNHMMMLRGETLRSTNLNHLFSLEFKDEGATRCPVFVMMITGGKTNQEMNKLYSGVIRHKNVYTCAFGALTRGQKADKSVSYNTQLTSIDNAFEAIGFNSKKKTHSGRQAVAREAEMAGLSLDHIRRVGKWNSESMENNYLTYLPQWQQKMTDGRFEQTICGEGFLRLLVDWRFASFSEELTTAMDITTPPAELEMQRIVSQVNSRINELAEQIRTASRPASEVNPALMEALKKIDERLDNLTSRIKGEAEEEEEDHINRSYKFNRDLTTVYALWKEWTIGVNEGQPSVNYMNELYGTKWRADAKYYSKRLIIINEIKRVVEEQDITLEGAVEVIENLRNSLEGALNVSAYTFDDSTRAFASVRVGVQAIQPIREVDFMGNIMGFGAEDGCTPINEETASLTREYLKLKFIIFKYVWENDRLIRKNENLGEPFSDYLESLYEDLVKANLADKYVKRSSLLKVLK